MATTTPEPGTWRALAFASGAWSRLIVRPGQRHKIIPNGIGFPVYPSPAPSMGLDEPVEHMLPSVCAESNQRMITEY